MIGKFMFLIHFTYLKWSTQIFVLILHKINMLENNTNII